MKCTPLIFVRLMYMDRRAMDIIMLPDDYFDFATALGKCAILQLIHQHGRNSFLLIRAFAMNCSRHDS